MEFLEAVQEVVRHDNNVKVRRRSWPAKNCVMRMHRTLGLVLDDGWGPPLAVQTELEMDDVEAMDWEVVDEDG